MFDRHNLRRNAGRSRNRTSECTRASRARNLELPTAFANMPRPCMIKSSSIWGEHLVRETWICNSALVESTLTPASGSTSLSICHSVNTDPAKTKEFVTVSPITFFHFCTLYRYFTARHCAINIADAVLSVRLFDSTVSVMGIVCRLCSVCSHRNCYTI